MGERPMSIVRTLSDFGAGPGSTGIDRRNGHRSPERLTNAEFGRQVRWQEHAEADAPSRTRRAVQWFQAFPYRSFIPESLILQRHTDIV